MPLNYRSRAAAASAVIYTLLQGALFYLGVIVMVRYPPQTTSLAISWVFILGLVLGLVVVVRFRPAITTLDFALKFWVRTTTWMLIMQEHPLLRRRPLYRQARFRVWQELDKDMSVFHSPINRDWTFSRYISRRNWARYGGTIMRGWGLVGIALSISRFGWSRERYIRLNAALLDLVALETLYAIQDGTVSDDISEVLSAPPSDEPESTLLAEPAAAAGA